MAIIAAAELPDRDTGSRMVSQGKFVRLARGLYTDEVNRPVEDVVAEHWLDILSAALPGAVITDRSAFVGRPDNGYLYVAHPRARELALPGLTIVPGKGLPAQSDDMRLGALDVYQASRQRALVDNLTPSRASGGRPGRTLTRAELHDEVVKLARDLTPEREQRLLNAVDGYAARVGHPEHAESVRVFFESAHGRRPSVDSESTSMRHAQHGAPVDERRVAIFEQLAVSLGGVAPKVFTENPGATFLPFFEAYFSNYIEGTEFNIDEARAIVFDDVVPEERPADAHDVTGTYAIVNDPAEMRQRFDDADEYLDALRRRHASIMSARPERRPGMFKDRANRAGDTEFVRPEFVEGTLRAGWQILAIPPRPVRPRRLHNVHGQRSPPVQRR